MADDLGLTAVGVVCGQWRRQRVKGVSPGVSQPFS